MKRQRKVKSERKRVYWHRPHTNNATSASETDQKNKTILLGEASQNECTRHLKN
jgi:hypothetical protein